MMKSLIKIFFCIIFSLLWRAGEAQANYWNMPLTETMISHNQTNYSDNKTAAANQALLTTSEAGVQAQKNQCKKLMDSLDKRLNEAYIVIADIVTAAKIAQAMQDIYEYQSEAVGLATQHPVGIFLYYNNEATIITDMENMYKLVTLIIISYGDINKLNVTDRKIIYTQVYGQMNYLRNKCQVLVQLLKEIQFSDLYKNTNAWQFVNQDGDKVKSILNDWKH